MISYGNRNLHISAKKLSKALGLVCSLRHSHGQFILSSTRQSQHELGLATHFYGWDSFVKVTKNMTSELSTCVKLIYKYNGCSFSKAAALVLTTDFSAVMSVGSEKLSETLLLQTLPHYTTMSYILTNDSKIVELVEPPRSDVEAGITELARLQQFLFSTD